MQKTMKKALRRHHRLRKIQKTMNTTLYLCHFDTYQQSLEKSKQAKKWQGQYAMTPTPCSCFMCGNPRKYHRNGKWAKTLQERRIVNDEMLELMAWYEQNAA